MKRQLLQAMMLCALLTAACGKSYPPVKPLSATSPVLKDTSEAAIKSRLDGIEKSGSVGSALAGMKEAIEKLPAEKSGPLLKDLEQLQQAQKVIQVKEIAKRMLEKL